MTHENLIQITEDYKQSLLKNSKITEEELNTLMKMATKNERIRIAKELLDIAKNKPSNTIAEKLIEIELYNISIKLINEC